METNILKKSDIFESLSDSDWLPGSATSTMNDRETLSEGYGRLQPIIIRGHEGSIEIVFESYPPSWIDKTIENMKELLSLPENWDSYGVPTISLYSVGYALQGLFKIMESNTLLPIVVPTSHGGIQLEWHTRGIDLELETTPLGNINVFAIDQKNGTEWEGELSTRILEVNNLISRLSA